ncbi:unnamed protein product, partial [Amoebophrya sp. A25]
CARGFTRTVDGRCERLVVSEVLNKIEQTVAGSCVQDTKKCELFEPVCDSSYAPQEPSSYWPCALCRCAYPLFDREKQRCVQQGLLYDETREQALDASKWSSRSVLAIPRKAVAEKEASSALDDAFNAVADVVSGVSEHVFGATVMEQFILHTCPRAARTYATDQTALLQLEKTNVAAEQPGEVQQVRPIDYVAALEGVSCEPISQVFDFKNRLRVNGFVRVHLRFWALFWDQTGVAYLDIDGERVASALSYGTHCGPGFDRKNWAPFGAPEKSHRVCDIILYGKAYKMHDRTLSVTVGSNDTNLTFGFDDFRIEYDMEDTPQVECPTAREVLSSPAVTVHELTRSQEATLSSYLDGAEAEDGTSSSSSLVAQGVDSNVTEDEESSQQVGVVSHESEDGSQGKKTLASSVVMMHGQETGSDLSRAAGAAGRDDANGGGLSGGSSLVKKRTLADSGVSADDGVDTVSSSDNTTTYYSGLDPNKDPLRINATDPDPDNQASTPFPASGGDSTKLETESPKIFQDGTAVDLTATPPPCDESDSISNCTSKTIDILGPDYDASSKDVSGASLPAVPGAIQPYVSTVTWSDKMKGFLPSGGDVVNDMVADGAIVSSSQTWFLDELGAKKACEGIEACGGITSFGKGHHWFLKTAAFLAEDARVVGGDATPWFSFVIPARIGAFVANCTDFDAEKAGCDLTTCLPLPDTTAMGLAAIQYMTGYTDNYVAEKGYCRTCDTKRVPPGADYFLGLVRDLRQDAFAGFCAPCSPVPP